MEINLVMEQHSFLQLCSMEKELTNVHRYLIKLTASCDYPHDLRTLMTQQGKQTKQAKSK